MEFVADQQGDRVIVTIRGELDAKSAPLVREKLDDLIERQPREVLVDLSALRLIDSTGVGAIVSLFKRTRAYGGAFRILGIQGQPSSIFKLLRLDRIFVAA